MTVRTRDDSVPQPIATGKEIHKPVVSVQETNEHEAAFFSIL